MIFNPLDYSVVFLSYDEPNSDSGYQHLLTLCPLAQRVHGVKGSDTAHKEVAKLSKTKNVIIVDADNYVKPSFFTTTFILDDKVDLNTSVLSYSAYNPINGCQYGNGGIKIWPVELLKNMETHENSSDSASVDFDMNNYLQLNTLGSDLMIVSSPLQAWRAGFREGVKLCMDNGKIVDKLSDINWRNFDRLYRWTHVGSDKFNGLWAIHGARMGCYMALIQRIDLSLIRDFDYLNTLFNDSIYAYRDILEHDCNRIGTLINDKRIGNVLRSDLSKEFREIPSILRSEENFIKYKYHPPYDIVYISNDEPNSEKNYIILADRFPRAKRAGSVTEAAKLCDSDYFWVVDHNSIIVEEFNFEYLIDFYEPEVNRVFMAKQVDGTFNHNGAVKLLPRMATIRQDVVETTPVIILSNISENV